MVSPPPTTIDVTTPPPTFLPPPSHGDAFRVRWGGQQYAQSLFRPNELLRCLKMVEPALWWEHYDKSDGDSRRTMRDEFVRDFRSITDLKQRVELLFSNLEPLESRNLVSSLIMALVKLRGNTLEDRKQRLRKRRPKRGRRRPSSVDCPPDAVHGCGNSLSSAVAPG